MDFELNFASYAIIGTGLFLLASGILINLGANATDRQDKKRKNAKENGS